MHNHGGALCSRCGNWITDGDEWELDHSDDRAENIGIAHATCNRARRASFLESPVPTPRPVVWEKKCATLIAPAEKSI